MKEDNAVAKRRRNKNIQFFDYECSLTGESFRTIKEAKNPDELISVKAYYELNPEKDDRPEVVKKKLDFFKKTNPHFFERDHETKDVSSLNRALPV